MTERFINTPKNFPECEDCPVAKAVKEEFLPDGIIGIQLTCNVVTQRFLWLKKTVVIATTEHWRKVGKTSASQITNIQTVTDQCEGIKDSGIL